MIPLVHDFSGETVLVLGAGPVGARKARRFAAEADVVVVAPDVPGEVDGGRDANDGAADRDADVEGATDTDPDSDKERERDLRDIEFVEAAPDPDAVGGLVERFDPALVVAATDDEAVNDAAEAAARAAGALVNRADQAGARDVDSVVVPATVDADPVTIAVSTAGTAPALAKHLRERIEAEVAGAGEMAELLASVRADLKERGVPPEDRRDAVRAVARSSPVWKALQGGEDNPRDEAADVIDQQRGDSA